MHIPFYWSIFDLNSDDLVVALAGAILAICISEVSTDIKGGSGSGAILNSNHIDHHRLSV